MAVDRIIILHNRYKEPQAKLSSEPGRMQQCRDKRTRINIILEIKQAPTGSIKAIPEILD